MTTWRRKADHNDFEKAPVYVWGIGFIQNATGSPAQSGGWARQDDERRVDTVRPLIARNRRQICYIMRKTKLSAHKLIFTARGNIQMEHDNALVLNAVDLVPQTRQ